MTKKEYHQIINSKFYDYITKEFPEYQLDFEEGYGRVTITDGKNGDNDIEYHQSRHDLCDFNWSSKKTKKDLEKMEKFLQELEKETKEQFQNK